jgi:hypothetical protein
MRSAVENANPNSTTEAQVAMQSDTRFVVLTKKLADYIDGVDLTSSLVGEILEASQRSASLLIAEGWAEQAVCESATFPGRRIT